MTQMMGIQSRGSIILVIILLIAFAQAFQTQAENHVSFRRDVMAVLSKAGCNMGACHGNQNGKYGFRLSLRGESPEWDYFSLAHEYDGRRINPWIPQSSLILEKSISNIAHEGGKRFGKESIYYSILLDWIKQGALDDKDSWIRPVSIQVKPSTSEFLYYPRKSIKLSVLATFEDGTTKDVSNLAVYEPSNTKVSIDNQGLVTSTNPGEATIIVRYLDLQKPVRVGFIPANPEFVWTASEPANFIDNYINDKLKVLLQNPSENSSDYVFLRRVYMDLSGLPPHPDVIKQFVEDNSPDKRAAIVLELMETKEFAEFWALKWADLLRVEEKSLDRKGVRSFYQWIQNSIANHKPLDQFAKEILTARGSTYKNPPSNFYRANRSPTKRSVATAQVFLGTRLQCAECHNHPFDVWTQNDYYSWASAFASIDYKILENNRKDGLDKHEFIGEQIIFDSDKASIKNPTTNKLTPARVLGGDSILPEGPNRKHEVADWLTAPSNKQFARVQVNRIWFQLMGRGLVDPVDDFRSTNPASHPDLLEALTNYFISHDYHIRPLITLIMTSNAYQRSSMKVAMNKFEDPINYARNIPRRFSGEQILDAQCVALETSVQYNGYAPGTRAGQIPGVEAIRIRSKALSDGDKFLRIFGKPLRLLTTDEERTCSPNMTQAFQMISSPLIHNIITDDNNALDKLSQSEDSEFIVETLFLKLISRQPNEAELNKLSEFIEKSANKRESLEDICWALINSKEFLFRY